MISGEYWKLSDFDFDLLWKQVIDEVKSGKVDFKEHVKLFAVFKYLMNSDLITYPINDLKQIFILGMQVAASEQKDNIKNIIENVDTDYDIEDKDIEEIKNHYIDIKKKVIEDIATEKATELFRYLPNDIPEFYRQIMGEYKDLPVFSRYDMDDLYQKLQLVPNYDLYNIINMMQVRYNDKKELYKADSKNLKYLSDIIRRNRNGREKTIKMALFENLASNIEKLEKIK